MISLDGVNNLVIKSDEPVAFIIDGHGEIKFDFDKENCYIMVGDRKYVVDFKNNKIIGVDQ